ncbi:hypothetical protein BDP27DRAFT_1363956 [Rhodocollybia butyracea]|uniref:Uncharacterized protein n=1 Tax=Rhodocollybia butyracea TaxID=206335 RepID=A0A9P5U776_9AGAR|nr:hypothetical protein BDP27DRAFT_1363956 [Rhodocollybia butyracea]
MRYTRRRVSSLMLLLSFIAHFTHGAPVSSLASSELENDSDSYMDVYDSTYYSPDFDTSYDHNLEPPDPISGSACSSQSPCGQSSSDLAVRSPAEVTIHRRRVEPRKTGDATALKNTQNPTKEAVHLVQVDKRLKKAKAIAPAAIKTKAVDKVNKYNPKAPGGGMALAGEVVGKVGSVISKIGNIVPGPIGIALKVIGTFLSIFAKFFDGIAEKQRKSAQERGDFTQKVVNQTAEIHKGWLIVTVFKKWEPQPYFPGKKGNHWSVGSTSTHTDLGNYTYNVYAARSGLFYHHGDRGYLNQRSHQTEQWAWKAPEDKLRHIPDNASDVEKRIVVVDGDYPHDVPPVKGRCSLHVDVFENKKGKGARRIVAGLRDDAKNVIGADSGLLPFTLHSQLTDVIILKDPPTEKGKKGKKGKREAGHRLDITLGEKSIKSRPNADGLLFSVF